MEVDRIVEKQINRKLEEQEAYIGEVYLHNKCLKYSDYAPQPSNYKQVQTKQWKKSALQ